MDEGYKIAGTAVLGAMTGLVANKFSPNYMKNTAYTSISNGVLGLIIAFVFAKTIKSKMIFLFVASAGMILLFDGILQLVAPEYAV
jgi:tRNA-binding EMAP/Myf-like protein